MTWTKLDDGFYDCPKIIAGGNEVAGAFARSLSYCGRHNTNGFFAEAIGETLAGRPKVVQRLLELGLWAEAEDDQYLIPDYLKHNPSAEQVEKERTAARKRMRELRANGR